MEPAVGVALLWLAFAGTHVGLATARVRGALVARLGEWGFIGLFSLVASVAFAALVRFYADHRFEGAGGLALGRSGTAWVLLWAISFVGLTLALASFYSYPTSPYALGGAATREPRGLERVTRHPFFVGIALLGAAHALLATHLAGAVLFGGLAVYPLVGAWHQDRKLLAARGRPYADYLAATSLLPFGAVASGRQRIGWADVPWGAVGASAAAVLALRAAHESILAHGGVWLISVTVGGAAILALQSWRRAVRQAGRATPATAR
jgi:uncharacterized membrane protein